MPRCWQRRSSPMVIPRSASGSMPGARRRRDRWPNRPNDDRTGLDNWDHRWRPARPHARRSPRPSSAIARHIFDPHEHPAPPMSPPIVTRAAFDDTEALRRFGESVDVATYEFENLPVGPLECSATSSSPGTRSLAIAQDRAAEKRFIEQCGARSRHGGRYAVSPT